MEVTTYRHEGRYLDRRRPEHVRWGTSLADDLARRDFTVNAIAWRPADLTRGAGTLVDPYDGIGDLAARRAAGGGRSGGTLRRGRPAHGARGALRDPPGPALDPATEAAIAAHAADVASLSGERVRDELLRMLGGSPPPLRHRLRWR